MSKTDQAFQNISSDIYSTEDLQELLGNRTAIARAVENGIITKVSRGYYSYQYPISSEFMRIFEKYFSDYVVCGNSALFHQGLSDFSPEVIDLARASSNGFDRNNEIIAFHRYSPSRMIGIETKNISGANLKIFTRERSLFEVAQDGPNTEAFVKAINRYCEKEINFDAIRDLAKQLPHSEIILAAIKTLRQSKSIYN